MEEVNILEKCAEAVHKAYCNYHIKDRGVEYWTKGDYSLLDDAAKQIDRETVQAVFDVLDAEAHAERVEFFNFLKRDDAYERLSCNLEDAIEYFKGIDPTTISK